MKTWYSLQRVFDGRGQFTIVTIKAKTEQEAWEEAENYATNNSVEWLLTKEEVVKLRKLLDRV